MANDVMFEGKERRIAKIEQCLAEYGLASLEEARALCQEKGFDPYKIVKDVQPIAFENASWAYTLGSAIALKKVSLPLPRQRKQSVSDWKRFVFRVPLRNKEM